MRRRLPFKAAQTVEIMPKPNDESTRVHAPSETSSLYFEISGDFDRATAEGLILEIKRLGKQYGVAFNSRVERAMDAGKERSM